MITLRITAPHFCAAVDLDRDDLDDGSGRVVFSAPILRYMLGWDANRVIDYAEAHEWTITMTNYTNDQLVASLRAKNHKISNLRRALRELTKSHIIWMKAAENSAHRSAKNFRDYMDEHNAHQKTKAELAALQRQVRNHVCQPKRRWWSFITRKPAPPRLPFLLYSRLRAFAFPLLLSFAFLFSSNTGPMATSKLVDIVKEALNQTIFQIGYIDLDAVDQESPVDGCDLKVVSEILAQHLAKLLINLD